MARYTKTAWQDRAVQRPLTYTQVTNGDGSVTFTPAPGTITQAGTAQNALNLNNIEEGIGEALWFAVTANAVANAYTATLDPIPPAYYAGMAVRLQINAASTAAATINLNGLGAKAIKKPNGVAVANLALNAIATLVYNGTDFILQGDGGSGNAAASDLLSGKTASTDAGDITGSMPNVGTATNSISTLTDATGNIGANTVSVADGAPDGSLTLVILPQQGYYDGVNSKISIRFWGPTKGNIAAGTSIGWVNNTLKGTYTSDANAVAAQILNTITAYVNGAKITGTMADNSGIRAASTQLDATAAQRLYMKYPQGYGNTDSWVYKDEPNFIAANIPNGMGMFGLAGTGANSKRYASGVTPSSAGGVLTVSGLTFQPRIISVEDTYAGTLQHNVYNANASSNVFNTYCIMANGTANFSFTFAINASGFTLSGVNASINCTWKAFE